MRLPRIRTAATVTATAAGTVGAAVAASHLFGRPSLPTDADCYEPAADSPAVAGELRARFLGVSSFVITDGETTLITDGFFSRPSKLKMITGAVRPDCAIIDDTLARLDVDHADAVVVAHSHYDHAMDSPVVAQRTGAALVGSESTMQIGHGYGLSDSQLLPVQVGEATRFGRFELQFVLSAHAPHAHYPGNIDAPITPPARISAYRMAECYSILITHSPAAAEPIRILLHASAGFVAGALSGHSADVAYLGIGTLGKRSVAFQEQYWNETVRATGARKVIPIHWDDFTLPLSQPLVPFPYFADNFSKSWSFLQRRSREEGVPVKLPTAWVATDPRA